MITHKYDPIFASAPVADQYLSDHSSVLCSLNTMRPRHEMEICYRQLKAIDFDALRLDLEASDLCSSVCRDLNELTSIYQSTLSILLEKHALLKV